MRILIIDNTIDLDSWGSPDLRRLAHLAPDATIEVRRAPQQDLPKSPRNYDRIILSGSKTSALDDSPWINDLFEFIQKAIDLNKPFLGVCYGHQALVRTLGGNKSFVRKSKTPEFGWTEIHTVQDSPLTKGLSSNFFSFSAHFEEVAQLPAGVKRLAYSEGCEIQACQFEDRPIFGIQFHPEKSINEGEKILKLREKERNPLQLLNPKKGSDLYNPKVGETLFNNFFKEI